MTTNDIDAIRAEWLIQCPLCDAGVLAECVCPKGDVRALLSALCDEIEQLRARLAATEPEGLIDEPGPEITRVIDGDGDLWVRTPEGWRFRTSKGDGDPWAWTAIADLYGPLKAVES